MARIAEAVTRIPSFYDRGGDDKRQRSHWWIATLVLLVASGFRNVRLNSQQLPFAAWSSLRNPVLSYRNWSVKDAAMAYRKGTVYVFFSAFYPDRGRVRSHVVEVSTSDFKDYSVPILMVDGADEGWSGMCSPDVQRIGGRYVMTFNSWGDKPGKPNELFYMTSADLNHWSRRKTLALNLTGTNRVIDPSIAGADGGYYLIWKEGPPRGQMRTRMAFAKTLEGPFHYVGDGYPALLLQGGKEDGLVHENYEFVHSGSHFYLLTTDYAQGSRTHSAAESELRWKAQGPRLYQLKPASHWLIWFQGYRLQVPQETFNTVNRDNAAALYDWKQYDGYYYLIYAGVNERSSYARRGWNRLGLARSKDLVHWNIPGEKP